MTNSPDNQFHAPHPAAPPASHAPPAGWYPDPESSGRMRWWDGSRWSEHRTDPSHAAASPVNAIPQSRSKRNKVALIVLGALVAFLVALAVIAGVLQAVRGATGSAGSGGSATELTADVPAEWVTAPVLNGAGTFSYDPAWEDATSLVSAFSIEEAMAAETGLDTAIDGAWFVSGDEYSGGTIIMVLSIADAPGPSAARIEAQSFIAGATQGLEGARTTSQGAVTTAQGLTGFTAEFEYPLYDDVILNSVGVVVDGERQVLISATGSPTTGAGTTEMEAVLNSLQLD